MHKNTDYIACLYAQEENIGIKHIKEGTYPLDCDVSKTAHYIDKHSISYMIYGNVAYHKKLIFLPSKPHIVYYIWDIWLLDNDILWIVGPRMMSLYGQKILDILFPLLSWRNIATISGWADWVDTYAHTLSMQYKIPTIVVLGWWLGHYLRSWRNAFLEKVIATWWLIISDYKLFYPPQTFTFPARNRIIAWLSKVLFVPEATQKSWSLITVDFAHKLQTPIYAPMQDIFSEMSEWTNRYIQNGIISPVQNMASFLDLYFPSSVSGIAINQQDNLFDTTIISQAESNTNPVSWEDFLINQSLQELGIGY
jgi:DNA processing protein